MEWESLLLISVGLDLAWVDDVVWGPGVVQHDCFVSILVRLVETINLLRLGVSSVGLLLDLVIKGLGRSVSKDDLRLAL